MNKLVDKDALKLKEVIAKRFLEIRIDINKSQQELADDIGVTQNVIFRLEDDLKVSSDSLFTIFLYYYNTFRLNPEWLFSPDNKDVSKFYTAIKLQRRKLDSTERKKVDIFNRMLKELREVGLINKEEETSSEE